MKLGFEPFEFSLIVCFKGGGGGGSSGAVSYPDYLEATHSDWLSKSGTDLISKSITDVVNESLDASPFVTATTYNPDADITAWENAIASYAVILAGLDETTDWETLYNKSNSVITPNINADVAAFADQLDDEINTKVLPRFRRGMQDINAVVSSAFVIGESVIEGFRNRDVAKHASSARLNALSLVAAGTEQMIGMMSRRIAFEESYAKFIVDSRKIKIVAKTEETERNIEYDEEDALWNLKLFQYGANLMAAPGGGTATNTPSKLSKTASTIGGAAAGAGTGAVIAGPYGAAVGAVLGAAYGYFAA
jgi:hypothetical protein